MKKLKFLPLVFIAIMLVLAVTPSCDILLDDDPNSDSSAFSLGWLFGQENPDEIESDINLSNQYGNNANLPSSIDLYTNFPPIGDQGQYGTCVAWACGYNLRSFLMAKQKGYTTNDMTSDSKVFSPKDLFWAIPNSSKGSDCNGTSFEAALDVMVSRGIATMNTVPYTGLSNCSASPQSSWTSNANQYKIASYRKIDVDKNLIKKYLAEGRAVVFGAKLGDEFMNANSSAVLSYQTYGYTGQHAYHAMILCGYDDNKGSNGAFRVVNSWGKNWGDNGFIWVDQNYFVTADFCFCAFVGTNQANDPDGDGDNEVDDPTSGYDVMAWELNDNDDTEESNPRWRVATYNVYNSGTENIPASKDWNILYIYYNAFNAKDYGIILYDSYSDDYGTPGGNGELPAIPTIPAQGYWWNYVNVASGQSVSKAVFGNDNPFRWGYYMPNISGDYYLVIIADGFDVLSEADEDNNYYFYAHSDGSAIKFENGVMINPPSKKNVKKAGTPSIGENSDFQTVRTSSNVNAYTTKEIMGMIKHHKQTGELQQKAMNWTKNNRTTTKRSAN